MVIERKKSMYPTQPLPNLDPLTICSPVIGTPTLGQGHRLGPPPHDLHAEPLVVSPLDIALQFKPRRQLPVTKEGVPPGKKKRVRQQGLILDRLLQELRQKWPLGFDGKTTSFIRREIKKSWPNDRIDVPSRETVARHLGRRKD
jgi:hypothetical protein